MKNLLLALSILFIIACGKENIIPPGEVVVADMIGVFFDDDTSDQSMNSCEAFVAAHIGTPLHFRTGANNEVIERTIIFNLDGTISDTQNRMFSWSYFRYLNQDGITETQCDKLIVYWKQWPESEAKDSYFNFYRFNDNWVTISVNTSPVAKYFLFYE